MTRLRPATEADAERAAELVIAVDVAEMGEPDYSLEDLRDEWGELGFDLSRDSAVVEGADGRTIGYAHFRSGDLLAVVQPGREGEGAGSALLEWAERRGRERGETRLRQGIGDRATTAATLLKAHGYAVARSYYRFERELGEEAEPEGLRALRPDDVLFAIYEAAFGRSPDYVARSRDVWTQRHLGAHNLDAETSRVAEGRGFALVRRWEDEVAYIELLAVHPAHAGQGLGTRLLHGAFAAAARNGYRRATLNVASDNPTAQRLYERVGMTQRWRIDDYHKPLPH